MPTPPNASSVDLELIDEVNKLTPQRVLDVGCGSNEYKSKIKNLIGIDPSNPKADVVTDLLDYEPKEKFDVILCLGSINLGTEEDILKNLRKVRSLLAEKGRVYMRVNPGVRWEESPDVLIYPWSPEKIKRLGNEAGFALSGPVVPLQTTRGLRYRFVYITERRQQRFAR